MPTVFPPPTPARDTAAPPRSLQKGQQTRSAILEAALGLASHMGLEGLSIGALAELMGMSKSGVFAHFGSREELQISVVREYHAKFEEEVFYPAMAEPRGLPRLAGLFERWVRRVAVEIDSGCIYISGAVEFDDRPGPVRDALAGMVQTWQDALARAIDLAVAEGHLRPDTEAAQLLFEVHGLILALHHDARFLRNPDSIARARRAFDRVIAAHATEAGPRAAPFARPPFSPSFIPGDPRCPSTPRRCATCSSCCTRS
ncbi:TetR/AcrR family transcriptional regulator [Piscinibacter sakaiensis]|uniref:TetR/AcrR family transcriptional regulator n=1 Tax=Piscinibacter sakaiensis TaxID=1547922 RepID=UPI00372A1C6E